MVMKASLPGRLAEWDKKMSQAAGFLQLAACLSGFFGTPTLLSMKAIKTCPKYSVLLTRIRPVTPS
jgi:hypothetical protein